MEDTAERPRIEAPLVQERPWMDEPAEPVDPVEPVDLAEPVDPVEPVDLAEPGEATQWLQPVETPSVAAVTHADQPQIPVAAGVDPAPVTVKPRRKGLVAAAALVVLVGGYAAVAAAAQDKLPRGTTVAGVGIGGQTSAGAVRTLEDALSERSQAPIAVTVDGAAQAVSPGTAGLGVDYPASAEQADPISGWGPLSVFRYLAGGKDLDPAITVDQGKFDAVLEKLGAEVAQPPREGGLRFVGTKLKEIEPRPGRALDIDVAGDSVKSAYLVEGATAALETSEAVPDIDRADIDQIRASFAEPAMSGPIGLVFSGQRVDLNPNQFAPALVFKAEGGQLVPRLRPAVMADLLEGKVDESNAPVDATVRLVDGKPVVVKAKPGVGYTPEAIETAVVAAASDSGERTAEVKASKAQADFTTQEARALKIRRKVSSFTTYYPYAAYRNVNIPRAASLINGTVLKPGETFSMNGTVGERTAANGFTTGFIISNGVFAEDLGGGVSQVATTTYNAAFFAGLEDVEHWPHSFFIDRYPPGREATVAWGSKDLRFRNDTPYGVLIEAHVTPATAASSGVVTVSVWSTKLWDVTSSSSNRYNFTQPKTRTIIDKDDKCVPNIGYGGFDIDVTRTWRKPGESDVAKQETRTTTYIPADTVICKKPDEPPLEQ